MSCNSIHVGDIGTNIVFTIKDENDDIVSIASNTSLQVFIKKPDGTVLTKTGIMVGDGSAGELKYVSVSGDFSVQGEYVFQAKVVLADGTWYTSKTKKTVEENLA